MYKTNILSAISVIGILCIAILLHIYRIKVWGIDKEEFFGGDVVEHMDKPKKDKKDKIDKNMTVGELVNNKDMTVGEFIKKIVPDLHDEFFKRGDIKKIQGELTTSQPKDIMGYVQKMLHGCMTSPGPQGIQGTRGNRGADGGTYTHIGHLEYTGSDKKMKGSILYYDASKRNKESSVIYKNKNEVLENNVWTCDADGLIRLYAEDNFYLKNNKDKLVVVGEPRYEDGTIKKEFKWDILPHSIKNVNKKKVKEEKVQFVPHSVK